MPLNNPSQNVNPLARERRFGFGTGMSGGGGGDTTPGGATDVWMWEADTGVLWESGYFMQTE